MATTGASSVAPPATFLSDLVGAQVVGPTGERLGTVRDLVAPLGREAAPVVRGLLVEVPCLPYWITVPLEDVAAIDRSRVRLQTSRLDLRPFERRDSEVLLDEEIVGKQVFDAVRRRLVRVTDLQLAVSGRALRLVAIDVSLAGLLARRSPGLLRPIVGRLLRRALIPWSQVELFASEVPTVTLAIPHEKIARLHPADIADLLEKLPRPQASEVLISLSPRLAADAVQDLEPPVGAALVCALPPAAAARILEKMDPAHAADLLVILPLPLVETLLAAMEAREAAQLRQLMTYPPDSAGGMMTTDFVAIPSYLSARQALNRLRHQKEPPGTMYDVYVVDHEINGHLVGMVTLRQLVTAPIDAPLHTFMARDVVKARADDPADVVARTIAHYNLLALPVVDERDHLLGVVVVDDAIDVILPEEWRRRVPHVLRR